MIKKIIFLCIVTIHTGIFTQDSSSAIPTLDLMAQEENENEEALASLSEQVTANSHTSSLVGWVKERSAKVYARYIVCKHYTVKKVSALVVWIKRKKQLLLSS